MPIELPVRQLGPVQRIDYADCILAKLELDDITAGIGELLRRTPQAKLVINFADVQHLSSATLGMLVTVSKMVREAGGQLRFACVPAPIYQVFVTTRLSEQFQIDPDVGTAMRQLQ